MCGDYALYPLNWYPHAVNFVWPILRLKIWLLVDVVKPCDALYD